LSKLDAPPGPNSTHPLYTARPLGGKTRRRVRLVPLLVICSVLLVAAMLVISSVGLNALIPATPSGSAAHAQSQTHARPRPTPAPPVATDVAVGHVYFSSSGQMSLTSSQGIADEMDIVLANVPAPAPGKSYYAWLINDVAVESNTILLGQLVVNNGAVHFHYPGTQNHTNLLSIADRLLITEENTMPPPTVPSLDNSTWRYTAAISRTPNPSDTVHHYSELDHLRHLLAADPTMDKLGLPGGLDIWLFRDMQQVFEWTGSARDNWFVQGTALMQRQLIRILDALDGTEYAQQDVPPGTPFLASTHTAQVPLLEFGSPGQEPPALLYHIGIHLQGLVESPGVTPEQKQLAIQIDNALNQVQARLEQVRLDAKQLINMDAAQLTTQQALSILNDMDQQMQNAFVGQYNEATGTIAGGVTQIHYTILQLATLNVTSVNVNTQGCPCS
jgi:hypothetical protein